ncbi:Z-ring formation inhibitor MciZ [Paenibacillus sp. P96]|uniref:Z-ring formation inhibitor MciZ n=1 Tax=Paenibacillus zeirhizosphaerae TaxID=2987519 RepID=A0ABT9FPX3_9BACL|nr:Z-ring formation inhibitor MciZ [Paenibacillus sp. P96]MDP4096714.1 Z-ring formation inhibitor MciZ [Paenibacillus sp. P96]
MKSYRTDHSLCITGKAWQVRLLLRQWLKENKAGTAMTDLIRSNGKQA